MARTSPRVRRTQEQCREIVRKFQRSRLGTWEFYKREGLAPSSLQRWCSRDRPTLPRFVGLTPPATVSATSPGWAVELELPGGMRLRLRG